MLASTFKLTLAPFTHSSPLVSHTHTLSGILSPSPPQVYQPEEAARIQQEHNDRVGWDVFCPDVRTGQGKPVPYAWDEPNSQHVLLASGFREGRGCARGG